MEGAPPKPLWPSQVSAGADEELTFADFVASTGLSEEMARKVLEVMLANGWIYPVFLPLCPYTSIPFGEFEHEEDLPNVLPCRICGSEHTLAEIRVQVQFRVLNP